MKQNYLVIAVVALVLGTGAFFAGMKYQQMQQRTNAANFLQGGAQADTRTRNGQAGQGGPGMMRFGGGQGFRPVNGEILSSDDKSITVKMPDGSSKIVMLSTNATISKSSTATLADLKIGEKVMVFGSENSDGSITAQSIQLNPPMRASGGAQTAPSAQPATK